MPASSTNTNQLDLKDIQERISGGDQQAFGQLYHAFNRKLFHFSRLVVRSDDLAQDTIEDVFVNLWSNRQLITGIENITVYLYVAVKNRSLNALSKKANELITAPFDFLQIDINDCATNPYDLLITEEMMQRMQAAIRTLPPRCKMIFKLVREDGLKYREVSEILNISVNTIDAQMAIAVKRICEALSVNKTGLRRMKHYLQKQVS